MESRVNKYSSSNMPSRSTRNARLYREVYGKYDDLNNLPLEDNTDEIDMNRLQELLRDNKETREKKTEDKYLNIIEQRKRNIDEQRVYDINKILEKAKYENNKLKESDYSSKIDTSILSTLQNREITTDELSDVNEIYNRKQEKLKQEEKLSMTRELKFKELSEDVKENPLIDNVMPDSDLSLDLFENLKPTENTITTTPIKSPKKLQKDETTQKEEIDVHSGDTRDIDIIKATKNTENENDFFTSSYEFSESDFLDGPQKSSGILKIILLFLSIIVFAGVIAYFVLNYGIGA